MTAGGGHRLKGVGASVVFHDLGTPPMKNINRSVRVYSAEWVEGGYMRESLQDHVQYRVMGRKH
jgi:hypothetical protein